MSGTQAPALPYAVVQDDTGLEYVPLVYPKARGAEGTSEFGEIAPIRTLSYSGNSHVVGFWRVGPGTSPLYDIPGGDESGMVIRGSATIEFLADDDSVVDTAELRPDSVYTIPKGTVMRWTIHEDFKKFVIVADDAPPAG